MASLDLLDHLLAGTVQTLLCYADGRQAADAPIAGAFLSGSFNPLHAGHLRLAEVAAAATGLPAIFELPVINADKGVLAKEEVERRLTQFRGRFDVVLSRAPLFIQKAALFPGSVFVIGYDTAVRLVAPRYYGGVEGMHEALATIRVQGCRFLVAGRVQEGRFHTLADVALPPEYNDLFQGLPEEQFRIDLSSTELRAALAKT